MGSVSLLTWSVRVTAPQQPDSGHRTVGSVSHARTDLRDHFVSHHAKQQLTEE